MPSLGLRVEVLDQTGSQGLLDVPVVVVDLRRPTVGTQLFPVPVGVADLDATV